MGSAAYSYPPGSESCKATGCCSWWNTHGRQHYASACQCQAQNSEGTATNATADNFEVFDSGTISHVGTKSSVFVVVSTVLFLGVGVLALVLHRARVPVVSSDVEPLVQAEEGIDQAIE